MRLAGDGSCGRERSRSSLHSKKTAACRGDDEQGVAGGGYLVRIVTSIQVPALAPSSLPPKVHLPNTATAATSLRSLRSPCSREPGEWNCHDRDGQCWVKYQLRCPASDCLVTKLLGIQHHPSDTTAQDPRPNNAREIRRTGASGSAPVVVRRHRRSAGDEEGTLPLAICAGFACPSFRAFPSIQAARHVKLHGRAAISFSSRRSFLPRDGLYHLLCVCLSVLFLFCWLNTKEPALMNSV